MPYGLNIPPDGGLDLLSLGALIYRLDPGVVPFRKATQCQIHVAGGEYNVAANLADCFGLRLASPPRWWIIPSATWSPSGCGRWGSSRSTSLSSTTA